MARWHLALGQKEYDRAALALGTATQRVHEAEAAVVEITHGKDRSTADRGDS